MKRTVIAIRNKGNKGDHQFEFQLAESPAKAGGFRDISDLAYEPTTVETLALPEIPPKHVRAVGKMLYKALVSDKDVKSAFLAAEASTGPPTPIYIMFEESGPEWIPWETLCNSKGQFLSLSERMPIARVPATRDEGKPIDRIFTLPAKIFAVLSAANVSALDEWNALYESVRQVEFGITMKVLISEPNLMAHIAAFAPDPNVRIVIADSTGAGQGGGAAPPDGAPLPTVHIEVAYIDPNGTQLIKAIRDFNPHLLHFFCHGDSRPSPELQIAKRSWWKDTGAARKRGIIHLTPVQFDLLQSTASDLSIVALNCCKSSAGDGDIESIALSLVKSGVGFPAVVGMREPIDGPAANLFAREFYGSIFDRIERFLTGEIELGDIDWIAAMSVPRARLAEERGPGGRLNASAASAKEWTLPVIYVRPEPFRHHRATAQGEAEQLRVISPLGTVSQLLSIQQAIPGAPEQFVEALSTEQAKLQTQLADQ